jgi:hypothetical protein
VAASPTPRPNPTTAPEYASHLAASAERRLALVIGNSTYRSAAFLPNPRRDAKAVAHTFGRSAFSLSNWRCFGLLVKIARGRIASPQSRETLRDGRMVKAPDDGRNCALTRSRAPHRRQLIPRQRPCLPHVGEGRSGQEPTSHIIRQAQRRPCPDRRRNCLCEPYHTLCMWCILTNPSAETTGDRQ